MGQHGGPAINCPECNALNRPGNAACFLCGRRLDGRSARPGGYDGAKPPAPSEDFTNPYAVAEAPMAAGRVFKLNSLLLVIALIAVCLGVIQEAPGLGVPLAVASFIALTRTMIVSASYEGERRPLSTAEKLAVFFATISMFVVVVICVIIALFATCYAICAVAFPDPGSGPLWVLGIPVVILVAAVLLWGAWRLMGRLRRVPSIRRDEPETGPRRPHT